MHELCARSNAGKHPASQFPNDSGNEARPIVGLRKRARGVKVRSVTRPKHAAVFPRTATAGSRCTNCAAQCAQGSGGNERGNSAFAVKAACKCCRGGTAHCSRAKRGGCAVGCAVRKQWWVVQCAAAGKMGQRRRGDSLQRLVKQAQPYQHNPGETGINATEGVCQNPKQQVSITGILTS